MGYLTTIVIHNDALGTFKSDPKAFAEAIFDGIQKANCYGKEFAVPFMSYSNYIAVHPSRHADDETVFLHSGNGVSTLNAYDKDFEELAASNPKLAKEFIKRAQRILTNAKRSIK